MGRTIFHVDMDAFYASVEQRDHAEYHGKPVIVGADPQRGLGRGVVAACSYEARRFGVHSAMPIGRAFWLCPQGVYLRPDFAKYVDTSRAIRKIFRSFTDLVEPVSIDEVFLDMSQQASDEAAALETARSLKRKVFSSQQLTVSVGVGPNKFVAKIASDLKKPDGLLLVREEEVQRFLDPLPVSRIWGVGPKTALKLKKMGIETILQLRHADKGLMESRFGRLGEQLGKLSQGIDDRPVIVYREPRSVGHETTFSRDVEDIKRLERTLDYLCENVSRRLRKHRLSAKTVTLKLRYSDFTTITRQQTFRSPFHEAVDILSVAESLFRRFRDPKRKVRLLGVSVSSLQSPSSLRARQLSLFS